MLIQNTIAKYGIVDSDIYNFDETGFMMGVIAAGMVVTSTERRSNTKMAQPGNREWVTVIQAINSQGYNVPPYIIVAGQYHLSTWYTETSSTPDWVIATSVNGWTTNERGLDWVKHFDRHTKPQTKGKYSLLVVDGHESHHSADFELYCKANDIVTLCMPAHSSHILQPLDVGCFGPLKKAYGRQIEDRMRRGVTHITKEDFFPAYREAFSKAMTEKNIKGGFRGAGIVPLSAESVLSKLDIRLHTPTPPGSLPQTPLPWVSMTPSNPTEASPQSNFIKSRISRHQSSSPTSIYEAVERLSKGTRGIMHHVALLRSEVQVLREENNQLSRRRRVEEETRRSSGRKLRAETGQRRCGVCGNTGHNVRTCQFVEGMPEDEDCE
ncbi:pogo transposable element with krab domain [Colletotrichum incanum]|nr:pogo transposable element with krab domain [Colletotrichum incanum]